MRSIILSALISGFAPALVAGEGLAIDTAASETAARGVSCCAALKNILGSKLSFPNETAYVNSDQSYWTGQERDLTPGCIVLPTVPEDVGTVVKVLADKGCEFAIRSGGHMPWSGGSNIDGGITIDMSGIREVTLADDRKIAVLGAGARWSQVYKTLDALNSTAVGGRYPTVGVGGLTVGGGNSFFTARYGFAADNVYSFEIVLADGCVVNANATTRPDLFKALKGGNNNFGIVTRVTVRAIDVPEMWGGIVAHPDMTTTPDQLRNFVDFTNNVKDDPYASLLGLHFFANTGQAGSSILNGYHYTKPLTNNVIPAAFTELLKLAPQGSNGLNTSKPGPLVDQFLVPPNMRNLFATLTFKNDLTVLKEVREICSRHFEASKSSKIYEVYYMAIQPLPRLFTEHSLAAGGNVLGLDREQGNNILFLISLGWTDAAHDAANELIAKDVTTDIVHYLERVDAHVPFVYLNYANSWQNPLAGYGVDNVRFLKQTAKKYDPKEVFQRLVPGGFKVSAV